MTTLIGLYLAGFVLTLAAFRHITATYYDWRIFTAPARTIWVRQVAMSVMWPSFWVCIGLSMVSRTFRGWFTGEDTP